MVQHVINGTLAAIDAAKTFWRFERSASAPPTDVNMFELRSTFFSGCQRCLRCLTIIHRSIIQLCFFCLVVFGQTGDFVKIMSEMEWLICRAVARFARG